MSQYTKDELWKIFETLPVELKQAVFSEETSDSIREICQRNSVLDNQIGLVAGLVGDCLMGILHPEDFASELVNTIGADAEKVANISREVNRLILYPVKEQLYDFYKEITFVPSGKIVQGEIMRQQQTRATQTQKPAIQQQQRQAVKPAVVKPQKSDTYRETAE